MEKIYLIKKTCVFEDNDSHEWSTLYAVKSLEQADEDIRGFRLTEESNRLLRMKSYSDVLYKVYYKIDEVSLF